MTFLYCFARHKLTANDLSVEWIFTGLRIMRFTASTTISTGILLSGWDQVHWVLYLPAADFAMTTLNGKTLPIALLIPVLSLFTHLNIYFQSTSL